MLKFIINLYLFDNLLLLSDFITVLNYEYLWVLWVNFQCYFHPFICVILTVKVINLWYYVLTIFKEVNIDKIQ